MIIRHDAFPYLVTCLAIYTLMYIAASMLGPGTWGRKAAVVVGGYALIGVVILAAQVLWAILDWASVLDTEPQMEERRIKYWVLAAGFAVPLLLVARPDMDFQAILRSATSLYFIGAMVFVGWLARSYAHMRQFPRIKTYLVVYAAVVVLMALAELGIFGSTDGDYDYPREEPELASPLTGRERLLRNIVFYSVAGFVGVYSTRREGDPI